MASFVAYDDVGRIQMVGQCPDDMLELQGVTPTGDGLACIEGVAILGETWVDVLQTPPAVLPCEEPLISITGTRLQSIPYPADLTVYGPTQANCKITQSDVSLSFDLPGTYHITVIPEHPRWRLWEAEVVV